MKFWPFPLIRNHKTNPCLTKLFLMFAESDSLKVIRQDELETTVSCEYGVMLFWSANAYYSWGGNGSYTPVGGNAVFWSGELPSRYAVRAMSQALKSRYAVRAMSKALNWKPVKKKFKLEGA